MDKIYNFFKFFSRMDKFDLIFELYKFIIVFSVSIIFILMIIFGGDFHLKINF
jgi:hypothetical protein